MRSRGTAIVWVVVACASLVGCTKSRGNPINTGPTSPLSPATSVVPLAAKFPTDAAASQSAAVAICATGAPDGYTVAASHPVPVSQLTGMHGGPPPGIYPYASSLSGFNPSAVAGWCEFKGQSGYFASVVSPSGERLDQVVGYSATLIAISSSGPDAIP